MGFFRIKEKKKTTIILVTQHLKMVVVDRAVASQVLGELIFQIFLRIFLVILAVVVEEVLEEETQIIEVQI